jgi:hypothetical protein
MAEKKLLIYKVDTTGLDTTAAIKFANECRVDLITQMKETYSEEELKEMCILTIPTFQGDNTNIHVLTL